MFNPRQSTRRGLLNIILVGEPKAKEKAKKQTTDFLKTCGVHFFRAEAEDGNEARIWDAVGEDKVHYLLKLYFTTTDIILICCDSLDDYKKHQVSLQKEFNEKVVTVTDDVDVRLLCEYTSAPVIGFPDDNAYDIFMTNVIDAGLKNTNSAEELPVSFNGSVRF